MRFNERLPAPLLTPATREERGEHDEPISADEVIACGLVPAPLWREVVRTAHALYERGRRIAAGRGLILEDTKYEMGILDGGLVLADEVHTPTPAGTGSRTAAASGSRQASGGTRSTRSTCVDG